MKIEIQFGWMTGFWVIRTPMRGTRGYLFERDFTRPVKSCPPFTIPIFNFGEE